MRLAVLSDIHGNLPALEAVLADLAQRGVREIVNLGDSLAGPLWPAETAALLMGLDVTCVMGNQDRRLLCPPGERNPSEASAAAALSDAQRDWVASRPTLLLLDGTVLLVHGTPTSDTTYLTETVPPAGARPATPAEVAARLGDMPATTVLCGHSHLPRRVDLDDGRLVYNPGSVGLQAYADDRPHPHRMETGSPHARYGLVDTAAGTAETIEVAYDWEAAAAKAEAAGRPDWAGPLRTGRLP